MKKIIVLLITVFLVNSIAAQMDEKFYHPDKKWIPISISNYSEMTLVAEQDTLYPAVIKPVDKPKANILYFHGNGSNISKWIDHVKPLVDDGYQVYMLDYRGYGKSTGKPTHLNIAHDAQLLLNTLLQEPGFTDLPLIVYGVSIGTQVATHITCNNNDKVSALVLDGMMSSFTDIALATSPEEYHLYIKQLLVSPYSAKEDIQHIQNINLLVIHSEEDLIPISGARSVYESAVCTKKFWLYEGKHVEAALKYPVEMVRYINELITSN
ncbi:alpha/beta hydrolase [Bacteroides sp. 519]|uniref:alpha/beta hydrolase n=1 Tax=Bacteroides sp. 519 TaxID=2302937 RepID=UPI0013D65A78|nr:alpha/beta fold hydrolase [Bacteroides sp. 519]NDV60279.1 alpha/beta fold hydrolase [Bacteroides sp. 519]